MKTWHDYYPRLDIGDFLHRLPFPSQASSLVAKYAKPSSRILEAGIGTAVDSIYLSHFGYKVFGIDKDSLIIKNACGLNDSLKAKAKFIQMDAFKLGFKDNAFDIIFHEGVAEHYKEKEIVEMLREQLRVARLVIFGAPSSRYSRRSPGTYLEGCFGDEILLSLKQWKRILGDFKILEIAGHSVIETKYKRFLRNTLYLPFWFFNEKIWSRRYLPLCEILLFIITDK